MVAGQVKQTQIKPAKKLGSVWVPCSLVLTPNDFSMHCALQSQVTFCLPRAHHAHYPHLSFEFWYSPPAHPGTHLP